MSFWSTLTSFAKSAMTFVTPVIQVEQTLAPVIAAAIPGAAPIVGAINTGIASLEAVAPGVAAATGQLIADGEAAMAAAGPAALALDNLINSLFHVHVLPQAIVLTPKVTSATIPAAPGNALS